MVRSVEHPLQSQPASLTQIARNPAPSVIQTLRVRGVHHGELMGMAPTGKSVDLFVCNVCEVRDGKVYREREYFDAMAMMTQLGVVTPPA